jgi:drug/metabolite transporter (DMT)-like permease
MFFSAVKLTSIVDASVIGIVQPLLVLIAARPLFGERIERSHVFWILLAMFGVAAVVLGPGVTSRHQLVGDLLAVGAMLSWSAYWLISKRARSMEKALEYSAVVMIVAAVTLIPTVLLSRQSLSRVETGDWLWICLLAVVPGGSHLLMNWAHRYVYAWVSSVVGSSSALVAAVAAMVILRQPLSGMQVGGGLVAIAAIAVVVTRSQHPRE